MTRIELRKMRVAKNKLRNKDFETIFDIIKDEGREVRKYTTFEVSSAWAAFLSHYVRIFGDGRAMQLIPVCYGSTSMDDVYKNRDGRIFVVVYDRRTVYVNQFCIQRGKKYRAEDLCEDQNALPYVVKLLKKIGALKED